MSKQNAIHFSWLTPPCCSSRSNLFLQRKGAKLSAACGRCSEAQHGQNSEKPNSVQASTVFCPWSCEAFNHSSISSPNSSLFLAIAAYRGRCSREVFCWAAAEREAAVAAAGASPGGGRAPPREWAAAGVPPRAHTAPRRFGPARTGPAQQGPKRRSGDGAAAKAAPVGNRVDFGSYIRSYPYSMRPSPPLPQSILLGPGA